MRSRLFMIVILIGMVVGLPLSASATPPECTEWAAKIVSIEGRVESLRAGDTNWQAVELNDTYCPNDRVRTLEKSRAAIQLQNETILRLDQNTVVRFAGLDPQSPTLLELIRGSAFFLSRFPRTLTIETPFVNAASGGTEFHIEVNEEDQTTTITVIEGSMNVTNEAGSTVVTGGQAAITKAGQAPVLRVVVRARDAIQWALYYPPVLSLRDLRLEATEGLAETDWRAMVHRSIESYRAGDVAKAFSAIEGAPEDIPDPGFYTYRASLLLSVGRVDQARADIDKALGLAPRDGLALALQSIMAVVQNEPEKALKLVMEATEAAPGSVSVRIARSYAQQANFNLSEALAAAKEAVKLDPEASLAWARLAELWMSQGHLDEALDAAKKAEALNLREVRIQTVLGFAYLTQIKIAAAKSAFEKAIALNSADPLPRLGLGLARIREGDLEPGRKEIEIAATLDPNNALIRSYLGKAYYEEKRDPQAAIQLDMAKGLDPNDPTPYLYDAIRKQTLNRPVEALHDLQKSIELNDNRAVYRSRFLLDNDLAARSVSLGRIYDDLGFQQLALVEGWKSVNIDPANYSAHRFLADSYAALPRSEIARLSELLLAQLLQPLNNNPVQPRLGESAPAILAGSGPVDTSFNEFSQLFIRDRHQLLMAGVWGENETLGEEAIFTGLHKRFSYSLGQFHHETDGWSSGNRSNADISQTIYNAFTQVALTPKASIQAEFRYTKTKSGDIDLRFEPNNFSPTLRKKSEAETYRLGLHYELTAKSDLIANFLYQDLDSFSIDLSPVGFPPLSITSTDPRDKAYGGEAQYLLHMKRWSISVGVGHFEVDATEDFFASILGGLIVDDPPRTESDIHHTNIYAYSYTHLPLNATLTIGASGDLYDGTPRDRDQFNPKAGLIWNLTPSTTLRMAGFRVLKRRLVSSQTIEPTQVAGFQQFYDDPANGTDSWRYGVGVDQKVFRDLFGGLEVSQRDVEVPLSAAGGINIFETEERLGRTYLYWTPYAWLAASVEYQFERFDSEDPTQLIGPKVKTHRVPLGLNVSHPSGLFGKVRTIYVDQEGMFLGLVPGTLTPGEEQVWIIDVTIGYRIPRRLGIWTIEAKNLLDEDFRLQVTDSKKSLIQPERLIITKLTLSF